MTEEEREMEHRLTKLEQDVQYIRKNSDERLEAIMTRFDKIDRRWQGVIASVFAVCLTFGGIYLEAYFNKDPVPKSLAVVTERVW